jgi:precorrin-6B methylase 2
MAYYNKTIWGTITGKWLGCYEQEIQPVIAEMITEQYPTVIDIGAAEGYYAVGLALKMPHSKVISYDTDPIARFRQRQLAELNGISNLEVRKYCSASELETFSGARAVVICDIEGFEYELMDPVKTPVLRNLDILIEVHKTEAYQVNEGAELLENRFERTHLVTRFHAADRDREEMRSRVPELKKLTDAETDFALYEGRYPGQIWLWMKVRRN